MPNDQIFAVSDETREIVKASVAGLCTDGLRSQVQDWLKKLEGEQVYVFVRQIGVELNEKELRELVEQKVPK